MDIVEQLRLSAAAADRDACNELLRRLLARSSPTSRPHRRAISLSSDARSGTGQQHARSVPGPHLELIGRQRARTLRK